MVIRKDIFSLVKVLKKNFNHLKKNSNFFQFENIVSM